MLSDEEFAKLNYGQTPEEYIRDMIAHEKNTIIMGREIRYIDYEPEKVRFSPKEGAYFKAYKDGFLGKPKNNPYKKTKNCDDPYFFSDGYTAVFMGCGFWGAYEKGYKDGLSFRHICESDGVG